MATTVYDGDLRIVRRSGTVGTDSGARRRDTALGWLTAVAFLAVVASAAGYTARWVYQSRYAPGLASAADCRLAQRTIDGGAALGHAQSPVDSGAAARNAVHDAELRAQLAVYETYAMRIAAGAPAQPTAADKDSLSSELNSRCAGQLQIRYPARP